MRYLEQVKKLAEEGIDEEQNNVIGYHGTSIEAIAHLAQFGKLPANGHWRGKIFFWSPEVLKEKEGTAMKIAADYAHLNGIRWHVFKQLLDQGLVLEDKLRSDFLSMWESIMEIDSNGIRLCPYSVANEDTEEYDATVATLEGQSIMSHKDFVLLYEEIYSTRRGVVLGIADSISCLKPSDGGCADLVVSASQGLPIEHICGIEPMGQFEWGEIIKNDLANVEIVEG